MKLTIMFLSLKWLVFFSFHCHHRQGSCLQVACGHSHSLALVQNEESLKEHVYSWGLGSSGQLGLPKEQLQDDLWKHVRFLGVLRKEGCHLVLRYGISCHIMIFGYAWYSCLVQHVYWCCCYAVFLMYVNTY